MFLCYKDSENDLAFLNLSMAQGIYLRYRKKQDGSRVPVLTVVINDVDATTFDIEINKQLKDDIMPFIRSHLEERNPAINIGLFQP